MKICIITLPFNANYGGILQAYALQQILIQQGHEVKNVNRFSKGIGIPLKMKVLSFSNRFLKKYLFGKKVPLRIWPTHKELDYIAQNTNEFIFKNIQLTTQINSENELENLVDDGYDAFLVGSDQVWRPKYAPKIENHFFDFLKQKGVKRIAYAASFGVDNWEYSESQTNNCKELVSSFDAVSVREDSGKQLCKKFLKTNAKQVVDPTLLLNVENYIKLVKKDHLPEREESLLTYILDISPQVEKMIQEVESKLSLKRFSTMPKELFRFVGKERIDDCVAPKVSNWIKGFMDAEFVFTDSFHGTVFSILFNKQFISIGNSKRGISRFTSLLKMFNLEDRLITETDFDISSRINNQIDFKIVNEKLEKKRQEALLFLNESLTNPH